MEPVLSLVLDSNGGAIIVHTLFICEDSFDYPYGIPQDNWCMSSYVGHSK